MFVVYEKNHTGGKNEKMPVHLNKKKAWKIIPITEWSQALMTKYITCACSEGGNLNNLFCAQLTDESKVTQ